MDIFAKATKIKLRFDSSVGALAVEQLWDLPLTSERKVNLDGLARAVNRELKETAEESFVQTKPDPRREQLSLQLEILKFIINFRLDENRKKTQAAQLETERERLKSILETKKAQALENLSVEEIEQRLASLGA
ncbi:MAG: hypothetical protein CMK32_09575 [Porticoccaceae bacterium]|nr:hypothetical protein [Porticoccaceae bacterium]